MLQDIHGAADWHEKKSLESLKIEIEETKAKLRESLQSGMENVRGEPDEYGKNKYINDGSSLVISRCLSACALYTGL